MKIAEALITDITETVTTRAICGGVALMHGAVTITAMALLDDGRCVKLRATPHNSEGFPAILARWSAELAGQEVNPAKIVEDVSNPEPKAEPLRNLEI